ncbi:MAG TPA: thioredoxin [Candidatus Woesebacteria bacterium]|nr:thioredoxin [Candidatus Woesebacteria bacterium]
MPLTVNQESFQTEVLDFNGKVLVDFWASWCGPCRMLGPIIDEIGDEYKDKIKVVKIDVDENQNLALQYNISSIPAVLIFDQGKVIETIIGFHQKQDYLKALE